MPMGLIEPILFRLILRNLCYIIKGNLISGIIWWLVVSMGLLKDIGIKMATFEPQAPNIH